MSESQDRRTFVSRIAGAIVGVSGGAAFAKAGQSAAGQTGSGTGTGGGRTEWDLTWLDQLKGQHKQVYDLGGHDLADDPNPLRFPRNYLDTFRDVFNLTSPEINTVVGISNIAFPMNATDRLWEKYKLGERAHILDPQTKQPAVRNIFYDGGEASIKALQARGTLFWQCNIALGGVARQLSAANGLTFEDVRADLIAGLNPGVRVVPAHVMGLGLAQEHGFTYMKP
jgi:intracellular sulfur oxidation DsrE/DsrF family protein